MSVRSVKDAIQRVTQDRRIEGPEAQQILDAAGGTVSTGEERAIREAISDTGFEWSSAARQAILPALQNLGQLRTYAAQRNAMVKARESTLAAEELARLSAGQATETFGGTPLPEAVKEVLREAFAAGATAYDCAEVEENPAKDDHGDGYAIAGKWTPYPQDLEPVGNLAFSYTEITPASIREDMETQQTFRAIKGFRTESSVDYRTGQSRSFQVAEYEEVTRKGSGNITAAYDEASHPDTYARGRDGQKYASNFAILSDGTVHCVPFARRSDAQRGLILTNPSLARGQRMLFNGHIEMRAGVVVSIGMSGRLHKLASEGEAKFLNPIPLLQAWGFEVAPNLKLQFEGRGEAPKVDPQTHLIG